MPVRMIRLANLRCRRLIQRWRADARGVAAIEFALIVPMLGIMFVGAVEMSQAVTVDRRVTQVSSATADLVARADTSISQSDISDIMRVGSYILLPYAATPLQIVVRNITSSPTNAAVAKQSWSCTYNGTGQTLTCACSNTTYTLPSSLVTTNDSVVVSEVTYTYVPLIFNTFMKNAFGGSGASYPLKETVYVKPRSQTAMLLQANNTPCPSPTF